MFVINQQAGSYSRSKKGQGFDGVPSALATIISQISMKTPFPQPPLTEQANHVRESPCASAPHCAWRISSHKWPSGCSGPPKQDNPNHIFSIEDGFGFCFIPNDFQISITNTEIHVLLAIFAQRMYNEIVVKLPTLFIAFFNLFHTIRHTDREDNRLYARFRRRQYFKKNRNYRELTVLYHTWLWKTEETNKEEDR